jgi:hypothetical protein
MGRRKTWTTSSKVLKSARYCASKLLLLEACRTVLFEQKAAAFPLLLPLHAVAKSNRLHTPTTALI